MPTSIVEGKQWLLDQITDLSPSRILDLGPGLGTYARMLRPLLPSCRFTGIEIWEPYLTEYSLDLWYDEIIIGDVRTTDFPISDVIIMGDILEHMPLSDAVLVWDRARLSSPVVFASIPIIVCPQAEYENPYEQHVSVWTHPSVLSSFAGIDAWWTGSTIGVYRGLG